MRCATKQRRKRHNTYASRGRLAGKRLITERPASIESRRTKGHWEIDTVMGSGDLHCIVTLVERKTGTTFYFAHLYHSWERGSNENMNGLIRQYLPKRKSMAHATQHDCNAIAKELNARPRKRFAFKTPQEMMYGC